MNILENSVVSKNRSEIMGIAILWIYLFHSRIYFPDTILFMPFKIIKSTGYGGVDIFIFLSGFGLMSGMRNSAYTPFQFYVRRFFRILPAYWIVVIISLLITSFGRNIEPTEIFFKISSLGFWFGKGNFLWYIPAILALYLFFPLFYRFYSISSNKNLMILLLVLFSYLLCMITAFSEFNYLLIFLARIPLFILGAHFGYKNFTNQNIIYYFPLRTCFLVLICSFILLLIIKLNNLYIHQDIGLQWYPFVLIVYPLIIFLSLFFDKAKTLNKKNKFIALIIKIFAFLGAYSLEIYLLHENIIFPVGNKIWKSFPIPNVINKGYLCEYLFLFIITIILAFFLKKMTNKILYIHMNTAHQNNIGEQHLR